MPNDNQKTPNLVPDSQPLADLPPLPTDLGTNPSLSTAATSNSDVSFSDIGFTPPSPSQIPDPMFTPPQNSVPSVTQDASVLTSQQPAVISDGGNQNTKPPASDGQSSSVVTSTHVPQKYGGKKIIATIFSVLLIVGAVAAGVTLVQRQQLIEQEASSGSACDQSPDCDLIDNAQNSGSKTVNRTILYVDITDQDSHKYNPGDSDDGCRKVSISGNTVSWQRYGSGPECKDISNIQIWMGGTTVENTATPVPTISEEHKIKICHVPPGSPQNSIEIEVDESAWREGHDIHNSHSLDFEIKGDNNRCPPVTPTPKPTGTPMPTSENTATPMPTLPPEISAKCNEVKAYDLEGNIMTPGQLSKLDPGDEVIFAVSGQASSGTFSKARFTVNNVLLGETDAENSGEFYLEYTIPQSVTTFTVKGEVFHSSLGWI